MTRKSRKQKARLRPDKVPAGRAQPSATGNKRVAEQMRKILRTHYASKYRVQ